MCGVPRWLALGDVEDQMKIPVGTHVRLTKHAVINEDTLYQPEYWLCGTLASPLELGDPIRVNRYLRAARDGETVPQRIPGQFTSSPIESFSGNLITTTNSQWKLEVLEPLPATHQP